MTKATNQQSSTAAPRSKDDERVLVTPDALFRELGEFQGFTTSGLERYAPLFSASATQFMRRGDAERDPNFKQLIPYVLFVYEEPGRKTQVFAYLRGKGQGEARLRSKWSVGIGGHVNDADVQDDGITPFEAGTRREIAEEIALDAKIESFRRVGLVNDDSTEVGRVHLGVVCRVDLDAPKAASNEPDILEARFRDVDELLAEIEKQPDRFESWTALAMRGLFAQERR